MDHVKGGSVSYLVGHWLPPPWVPWRRSVTPLACVELWGGICWQRLLYLIKVQTSFSSCRLPPVDTGFSVPGKQVTLLHDQS